ncbi:MAG: PAS domain-containing protein [Pseudomonadota bacterium]
MQQRTNQVLYAYWNGVRGSRIAPRRFEIEPARIASILPETFILERANSDTYRFRLAGTRLCELFAREFRGSNFLDLWREDDRTTLTHRLHALCEHGAGGLLTFEAVYAPSLHERAFPRSAEAADVRTVRFELLLLPLIHTDNIVTRFVGAASALDQHDWLGQNTLHHLRLVESTLLWPDGEPRPLNRSTLSPKPVLANVNGARLVRQDRRQFRVYDGGLSQSAAPTDKPAIVPSSQNDNAD